MTTIDDLRKLHTQSKSWNPYAQESTWQKKHIDMLFSEINRLTEALSEAEQTIADYERQREIAIGMGWGPATPVVVSPQPASAPSAATAKRPIPVLSADEAELLDDMLAYDPHYERTEKRELKKHQMLVELEKQGLVFWYKNPGEDKAWTLSSWGRSVAAHYNVADDGSDDPTPQPPVASTAASAAPAKLTTKLTASNSIVLRNIKRMFNGRIFKAASIILNSEGEQAAIEMILTHYVREDRRDSMRAALQEAHHD